MSRFAALLVLLAPLHAAPPADPRLLELSRLLASHPMRAAAPGARLVELLAVSRIRLLALPAGDSAALRAEGEAVAKTDAALDVEFRRVERTLSSAGLAPTAFATKLAAWRDFTAHYRRRMAAVRAALARGDAATAASLLDVSPAPAHGAGGAATAAPRLSEWLAPPAATAPQADDTPQPGDLTPSDVVVITTDHRAMAAACNNSPACLYAFVHDNVELLPYRLSMQNSQVVLWSRHGNDFDQATLLIALMRAAGIPARYVVGTLSMPYADVVNWLGVTDLANARTRLNDLTTYTDPGDHFSLRHILVEAWVDSGSGPAWVAMSPSLKTRKIQPGIALNKAVFDRMQFLGGMRAQLATEAYMDQLLALVHKTTPGAGLGDLRYTAAIVPTPPGEILTLPYTPDNITARRSTVPSSDRHTVAIKLTDATSPGTVYLSTTLDLPVYCNKSLTISFAPSTTADAQVATAFGSLETAPSPLVNLTPQFRIDDTISLTAKAAVASGAGLTLQVSIFLPSATDPVVDDTHDVAAGQSIAIGVGVPRASAYLTSSRSTKLMSLLRSGAAEDSIIREFLNVALQRYFDRLTTQRDSLEDAAQIRFSTRRAEEAATIAGATTQRLFDRPFYLVPDSLLLDAKGMLTAFIELTAPDTASAVDQSLRAVIETASSGLEHQLWEELVIAPSISTVKALQLASQAGQQLVTLTSANAASQLAASQLPQSTRRQMLADADAGATIITALRPVTYNAWTGVAWIRDFPDGHWAYLIQNASGGSTTGVLLPLPGAAAEVGAIGDPAATSGTSVGDPVCISSGNLYQQETDLTIAGRGPSLSLIRTYNSLQAIENGPFGYGWTHSYNLSLAESGNAVEFVNESGGRHSFINQGDAYASPPGLNLALTKDSNGFTMRSPQGSQWFFNAAGKLRSLADPNGNTVQLTYDSANRLTQVADALNRAIDFTYDASNHIVAAQDFSGRQFRYDYDSAGRLTSFTDPANGKTAYGYAGTGLFPNGLTSIATPAGKTTTFEYFAGGRVAVVTEPGGRKMRFHYLPLRGETVYVDDRGYSTLYFFNPLGNVTRIVRPDGNIVDMAYSSDAKLLASTNEIGGVTTYTWDANGNLLRAQDPAGNTATSTYDAKLNRPLTVTDARGAVTRFEYDARGNLIHASYADGAEVRYTYDAYGNLLSFTDAGGGVWTYTYDGAGNLAGAADPLGNAGVLSYDNLGRRTASTDPLNNTALSRYDVLDRVTGITNAEGGATTFAYDSNGNLAGTTDPLGRITRYTYDALDRISGVTDAAGGETQYGSSSVACQCSASPDITSYRDPAGRAQSFTYDARDHLTQTVDGAGRAVTAEYDALGRLARKTDAAGRWIAFEYDGAGRVVRKGYSDGADARFTYDPNGNLLTAANANSILTFTYDSRNRQTSAADSRFDGITLWTYDGAGRRASMTDPTGGVFAYTYDKAGRLARITGPAGANAQFTRDAAGRLTLLAFSNGVQAAYRYDRAGRAVSLVWSSPAVAATLPRFSYTYDAAGNTIALADSSAAHQFQYDALRRLTSATHAAQPAETYRYDGAGHRTASATDVKYGYDPAGRVTSAEGATYTWDDAGNLISRRDSAGVTTYTYDTENRLTAIAFPNGGAAAYKYDALGRRIEKNVNGAVTRYLYDGDNILLEADGNNQARARYMHGADLDQPLLMERGGVSYFFHADAAGSVVALSDPSGAPVRSWTSDSFGRMAVFDATTQPATPYAFAGREYDAESGLYYFRARYYDPATGRFLSADPMDVTTMLTIGATAALRDPQLLNRYSYAANNPLAFRDPAGLKPDDQNKPYVHDWKLYRMGADPSFEAYMKAAQPDFFSTHNAGTIGFVYEKFYLKGEKLDPAGYDPYQNVAPNPIKPEGGLSVVGIVMR